MLAVSQLTQGFLCGVASSADDMPLFSDNPQTGAMNDPLQSSVNLREAHSHPPSGSLWRQMVRCGIVKPHGGVVGGDRARVSAMVPAAAMDRRFW